MPVCVHMFVYVCVCNVYMFWIYWYTSQQGGDYVSFMCMHVYILCVCFFVYVWVCVYVCMCNVFLLCIYSYTNQQGGDCVLMYAGVSCLSAKFTLQIISICIFQCWLTDETGSNLRSNSIRSRLPLLAIRIWHSIPAAQARIRFLWKAIAD